MSKSTEGLRSSYRNVVLKGILRIVRLRICWSLIFST